MSKLPLTKKPHAVIYIPGLGDSRVKGQLKAVSVWQIQGVESHLFQMNWSDGERFAPKLERLLGQIDALHAEGKQVSLIAASAGASAAMHAYAARPHVIHGVVAICGKLHGVNSVHSSVYGNNPAFSESMQGLEQATDQLDTAARRRILSIHAMADESVPIRDTRLTGTVPKTMPVAGHFFGIAYGLTLGSFAAIRFLKALPAPSRTHNRTLGRS